MTAAEANAGTTAVREAHRFDEAALARWLRDNVAGYCRRTGRDSIADYDFYIAFNFFRMAAIFHGIKGRVIRRTAVSAHAKQRAEKFPVLAKLARESMEACR